jgi:hypothetical protein
MGNLEELPFGAYPANTTHSWTLDHTGTRYEFVSVVFTTTHHNLELEAADFKAFRSNGVCIVQFMDPAVFAGAVVYSKSHYYIQSGVLFNRSI